MNVSADQFRKYLETFHNTLQETATSALDADLVSKVLHLSFLPGRIVGHVSTKFGVAIEYQVAKKTEIEVRLGSDRVEHLVFETPARYRDIPPVITNAGQHNRAIGLNFEGGVPLRLDSEDASFAFMNCRYATAGSKRHFEYVEFFGCRRADRWTAEAAVAAAKDEVIAALADAIRAKKRSVEIDEFVGQYKEKTVLVLGSYDSDGSARLEAIRDALADLGYEPLLVRDVPDLPGHSLIQKVVALGTFSRFVLVDDSAASGHLAEVELCKHNSWVTILMRQDGHHASWMTVGASFPSNVILEVDYESGNPKKALSDAIGWAEAKVAELGTRFDKTYPWRRN